MSYTYHSTIKTCLPSVFSHSVWPSCLTWLVLPTTAHRSEWKGRSDGLVAHVYFRRNANFAYAVFAFAVEGWIFYSAVNSITPQIVLNLGLEPDAWRISVRQLSYQLVVLAASVPVTWYATRYRDLRTPLLVTFTVFLIV